MIEPRTVLLEHGPLTYQLRKRRGGRHLWLRISADGAVLLTLPQRLAKSEADKFVQSKAGWIQKHLERVKHLRPQRISKEESMTKYRHYKGYARALALERLAHFNDFYRLAHGKISVRNQSSRWGSCSRENNLSFNYRIALLPRELADYIIVHELCHVREHSHQTRFWKLVAQTMPNYQAHRLALRTQFPLTTPIT